MLLNKKRLLAVSLVALSIMCVACTPQTSTEDEAQGNAVVNNGQTDTVEADDDTEVPDAEKIDIEIGLVAGSSSAIGVAPLFANSEDNSAYEKYAPVIYNSSDELLTAFNNGEVSVAVLPPDKAALCYTNTNCQIVAITNGCNYYIAENGTAVSDITDLNGKTITVSAEDTMADTILNIILNYNEISVTYNYVDTTEQLINGLKDGTISLALTQEPYLSQATDGTNVRSALDLYDFWNDAVDTELVTGCLVVNNAFISANPKPLQYFLKDYSASTSIAKRNTEETAQNASKYALTDNASVSKAAIPGCGIMFKTNDDMTKMLTAFYQAISESNNAILGGQTPASDFYYTE